MALTLIDAREAAILTGYHRITIYGLMRKGDFPKAVYVKLDGIRRPKTHFQKIAVEAWIAKRAAIKTAKRRAQS